MRGPLQPFEPSIPQSPVSPTDGKRGATDRVRGTRLDGLEVRRLAPAGDARGAFTEIYSADWGLCIAPEQWSLVHSDAGVLRGMHLHRRHDEYFFLLSGKAWIGLYDIRPGSPTEGRSCLVELRGDDPTTLSFPRGIVHGWCFPVPSVHLQATSETYGVYGADDNLGCHWSDPALGIDWPMQPTEVSPRAAAFPTLEVLREQTLRIDPRFAY